MNEKSVHLIGSPYACISQCTVQKMYSLKCKLFKEVLGLGLYLNLYHILHPSETHTEYWLHLPFSLTQI